MTTKTKSTPRSPAIRNSHVSAQLPELMTPREAAELMRISLKTLQNWGSQGKGPVGIKLGRKLVYRWEAVMDYLADLEISGASKRASQKMKITARPYTHNPSLFQVTMPYISTITGKKERPKKVAPESCKTVQDAIRWGEGERSRLMKDKAKTRMEEAPAMKIVPANNSNTKNQDSFEDFWLRKFQPEHIDLQKPATRAGYQAMFAKWFRPFFGKTPMDLITDDQIAEFRMLLLEKMERTSANHVLSKLIKAMKFAKKRKVIATLPDIERFKIGKQPDLVVYTDEEMKSLLDAAKSLSPNHEVVILLCMDAGLRISEVCALQWGDVDFADEVIHVIHNLSRGVASSPKGGPADVGMSKRLAMALKKRKLQEGANGNEVLLKDEKPLSQHAITWIINQAQVKAGLEKTGAHYLRHCCLSFLARHNKDPHKVKEHARHARLATTERYMHTASLARRVETASTFDQPAPGKKRGKKANAA